MKIIFSKSPFLSLLFALAVAVFWAVPYVCALSFQEQYQLFLFTTDYFVERISVPGGMADYIAEFVTQFNYAYVVGAVLLGTVFFMMRELTVAIFKRVGADEVWRSITFVPAFVLWAYMGNENVMLSFGVSLVAALTFMLFYLKMGGEGLPTVIFTAIGLPAFYWLFGASVWCMVLFAVLFSVGKRRGVWIAGAMAIYTFIIIYVCSLWLPYPKYQLFCGVNYFRYPVEIPIMQFVVMAAFAVIPAIGIWLPTRVGRPKIVMSALLFVIVLVGAVGVRVSFDRLKYDQIEYDYLVRTNQWNKIIRKAEAHQPTTPLGVSCVNLALAMNGQLGDRMFEFFQNGAEGLFPTFTRDMTSPLPTSEVFYRQGMINESERYAFEAQEAIPNRRRSGRIMRRLAQCNIVNGNYAVAAKYLRMLQKSLFYAKWADQQMRFIGNDKAVNRDAEYGRLRDLRIKKTDYLFSDREMDQMLGLLLVDNRKYNNRMAYDYLIAYELLQRDLTKFMKYYPLGKYLKFDHIPNSTQQILIGLWIQRHGSLDGLPYSVDLQNVQSTRAFLSVYMTNKQSAELNSPPLSTNVWRYVLLGSPGKTTKQEMKEIY